MHYEKKKTIAQKTDRKMMSRRACNGVIEAVTNPIKGLLLLLYIVGLVIGFQFRDELFLFKGVPFLAEMLHNITLWAVMFTLFMGLAFLLALFGTPLGAEKTRNNLLRAGLTNSVGETPILLSKRKNKKTGIIEWKFDACGIPRATWEGKQAEIEASLNISIVLIRSVDGKKSVILEAVPAKGDLPDYILWDDKYMSPNESIIRLGVTLSGMAEIDLQKQSHWLLSGSTNSGKTNAFKLIMLQIVKHAHTGIILDLKGGADFGKWWRKNFSMAFDEGQALILLESVYDELIRRKAEFGALECSNIEEYELLAGKKISRIVVGCDEAAELFIKGASKESKEIKAKIEEIFNLLFSQGRAFGINCILASQRGDATILPALVRSNCERIVGRCDATNSMIMLGNANAAKLIEKHRRGRFIRNDGEDGTLFQAFYLDDKALEV